MLNIAQFRTNIVRPTLEGIGAHNRAAENLVLGTGLQERDLHYLRQLNDGPARGIYQMEPTTHDDIRGLAEYWKQHYNTPQGCGTPDEFVQKFEDHVIRTGDT